jgi:hypothetical protein
MKLIIQAISPDNAAEIAQLTHLFCAVYGRRFPVKKVYDRHFWHSRIGSGFSSLVMRAGDEMVAHIACCTDRYDPRIVHLCFPACLPELTPRLPEIGDMVIQQLRRNSSRQGWTMLNFSAFSEIPLSQTASSLMGFNSMAILPCSYPASDLNRQPRASRASRRERPSRSHTINSQLFFRPEIEPARDLFVPNSHREICELLYSDLGLHRSFCEAGGRAPAALCADRRAVERNYFPATRTSFLFLQPSLVSRAERQLFVPGSGKASTVFAIANLCDPACPALCSQLEESGFRFCGILPLYKGRDSIIYFWSDVATIEIEQFETARARTLAAYIVESISREPDFLHNEPSEVEVYARARDS